MPEINIGGGNASQTTPTTGMNTSGEDLNDKSTVQKPNVTPTADSSAMGVVNVADSSANGSVAGLSAEEIIDPNKIKVTIKDKTTPIIILYGPPACGKTMTLVRLTRFLISQGYTVQPDRGFRPTWDNHYAEMCDKFNDMINSDDAASSTSLISFMLVKVLHNGHCLCQILEAPGEYYFSKGQPNAPYPKYFNEVKNIGNRKIWAVMVEPDWQDEQDRRNYVTRIHGLISQIRKSDRVVFVYNKIDLTSYVISPGNVRIKEAIKDVEQSYPNIFLQFKNVNPILKWFKPYDCGFVPFQTGAYTTAGDGTVGYTEGPWEYVANLWNELKKMING